MIRDRLVKFTEAHPNERSVPISYQLSQHLAFKL